MCSQTTGVRVTQNGGLLGVSVYTQKLRSGTQEASLTTHTQIIVYTQRPANSFSVCSQLTGVGTQTGGLLGVSVYTQKLRYSTQALCRSFFLLLIDKLPVNSTQSRSGVNRAAVAYTEKSDHTHKCSRLTNVADFVSVYYH